MGGRFWKKWGCWSMDMGGRAEDLEIGVLFFCLFADGVFAKFGPPGMEVGSRGGGGGFFASQVGWGRVEGRF